MKNCDIALYGLGVMGSSLAQNMIHHGFRVTVRAMQREHALRCPERKTVM